MWWSLLRGGQWSEFADLASPALFDVIGAGELMEQLKAIASGYWDRQRCAASRVEIVRALDESELRVSIRHTRCGTLTKANHGDDLLALYFFQLYSGGCTMLDLRRSGFRAAGDLSWDPSPLCVTWDPEFLLALRELYLGFYVHDDERYRRGLGALGLAQAENVFSKHFGKSRDGGPTRFSLAELRHTFHGLFVCCRDERIQLHPNFVALGVYLACLYEHLEELGGEYDVRLAFMRVARLAA